MRLRHLFNRPVDKSFHTGAAPAGTAAQQPATPVGNFITVQSLVSFPGATAAITVMWGVVRTLFPGAGIGVGFGICVAVGIIIYLINVTDPDAKATPREKAIGVVIAALNTLVLFSASFGVQQAIDGGGAGGT